jgi:hypothetical protein
MAVVAGVAAPAAAPASAQETPSEGAQPEDTTSSGGAGFAVQPSGPNGPGTRDWFIYTLNPGDVWGDTVAISNLSDAPKRFAIYATDAVSVADTGGFAALRDDEPPVDVGTWVTLAAAEYVVPPGQRIDVPFSLTVPDDAEPGDHAGAILAVDLDAGNIDPNTAPEGVTLDVRQRVGARIYVRVGGEISPALRIDELEVDRSGPGAVVRWEITNTGNIRLSPTAEVRVTGFLGRTLRTVPAQQLAEMLPGANLVGGADLGDLPSYERLTARLVLKAEEVEVEGTTAFGSYPWAAIAGVVLFLVALRFIVRWWRRRRARPGPPPTPAPEREAVPA